jgi:hypothetical protein
MIDFQDGFAQFHQKLTCTILLAFMAEIWPGNRLADLYVAEVKSPSDNCSVLLQGQMNQSSATAAMTPRISSTYAQ